MAERRNEPDDNWRTLTTLVGLERQSPWAKIWLLDCVARFPLVDGGVLPGDMTVRRGDHSDAVLQLLAHPRDVTDVGDHDAGAAGVEVAGECRADAPGGTGDDDVSILEVHAGDRRSAGS